MNFKKCYECDINEITVTSGGADLEFCKLKQHACIVHAVFWAAVRFWT